MANKKVKVGLATVAVAGAGATAMVVKNKLKKNNEKKQIPQDSNYRNTERGKHQKNSKGI